MLKTPFLGCAYYPEDWPETQIPEDVRKMREAGITCARIGEFAWRKMEPRRGEYDFGWLHRVVDALGEAGISVIMGTPTATPPIWLSREHPDVTLLHPDGTRTRHGGRRHCCSNNPWYLEASDAIVEAMGREFGTDRNVIGWQLDNEIHTYGTGCVCEHCMKAFHQRLEREYHTVEELNARWDLNLFSQAYDSFDEVPPAEGAWHNPHIKFEWEEAHHEADIAFMHRQAEILRRYTAAPIGTDMMPVNCMDYEAMVKPLDVVMFNHYNSTETLNDTVFWFDYLRTLKERPFWNTETSATWPGSVAPPWNIQPEGFCRLNSWLPVALGGESNMYWLWRQHWAGHELLHGSVLSPEGRPTHTFREVQQTAKEYEIAAPLLNGSPIRTRVAMHFSSRSCNLLQHQPVVSSFSDGGSPFTNGCLRTLKRIHRAVTACGVRPDVIGPEHSLSEYKVILSPLLMTLEEHDLAARMADWVKAGGVWITGPLTDVRNSIGAHYVDRGMGTLEALLGITLDYTIPFGGTELTISGAEGPIACDTIAECYSGALRPIASVTEGHSALVGKTVIGEVPCGKGKVILCGTLMEETAYADFLRGVFEASGVPCARTEGSVQVIHRGDALLLLETAGKPGKAVVESAAEDVLTGKRVPAGELALRPFDVLILRKI